MNKAVVKYGKMMRESNTSLWKLACKVVIAITSKISGDVILDASIARNCTISAGAKSNSIRIRGGVLLDCRIVINGTNSSVLIDENCRMSKQYGHSPIR